MSTSFAVQTMLANLIISISTLQYIMQFHIVWQHVECTMALLSDSRIFTLLFFSRRICNNKHGDVLHYSLDIESTVVHT